MEIRPLGRCGLKVSALSLGAMTFGESGTFMKGVTSPDDEARRVFDAAVDAGVNLVDTADVYGDGRSEELTGAWIRGKRDRLLLATKCRFPLSTTDPNRQGASRRYIHLACEDSLRRLDTDVIDLYQIHLQDSTVPLEETMRALEDLVRQGKVRYVACSNYTGYRLVESLWVSDRRSWARYEAVQLQWSLLVRDAEREVVPACRAHGLGTLVWSPLASGFLSGKYRRDAPPPAGARLGAWADTWQRLATERNWAILDVVRDVAGAHGVSPGAVSLAWLLARPEVTSIVLGARTVAQLEDNLTALNVRLAPDDLSRLDAASAPAWGYPYDMIGRSQPW